MKEAVETAVATWPLRAGALDRAFEGLARLPPEERLRWNDREVASLEDAIDEVRRRRGP